MSSIGIDRITGLPIAGLAHVVQCLDVVFTARMGDMVMLEWFGSGLPELLGRRATPRNLALYRTMIAVAVNTWEPRLDVVAVRATGNTDADVTIGHLRFQLLCYYRPNALQGDLTPDGGVRSLIMTRANGGIRFTLDFAAAA